MNRKALSELCNLSKNTVARYERGERTPDIIDATKIADFFEVSLDYLCGREKILIRPPIGGTGIEIYERIRVKDAISFTLILFFSPP